MDCAFIIEVYENLHLFLSNFSPDFGHHFYLLPVNLQGMVKFMLVSRRGLLVAITEENVVYCLLTSL